MLGTEHFAAAPVVVAADDDGIDEAVVEGCQQGRWQVQPHLDRQGGIQRFQLGEQGGHFRTHDMIRYAEAEAPARRAQMRHGALVGGEEIPGRLDEDFSLGRQPHLPRRTLEQSLPQAILEPLQFHADRALSRAEHGRRPGEALQVGNQHESPDGIHFQCDHASHPNLLSLK